MHYNIYTKKSKLVGTYTSLDEVKVRFKLSRNKYALLSNGVNINNMGLIFVAMEWKQYLYYGKVMLREIYYHKPTYKLDLYKITFKKTIKLHYPYLVYISSKYRLY